MKHMTIKQKLAILTGIPIIIITLISAMILFQSTKNLDSLGKLDTSFMLAQKISILIHETQKERGATAGYIGSKGQKFGDILRNQRDLTNKRLSEMKKILSQHNVKAISPELHHYISKAMNELSRLDTVRSSVDNLSIPIGKALGYYTNINGQFLHGVVSSSKLSSNSELTNQATAYANFLLSKERAGIERAVGSNALAKDVFAPGLRTKFNNLIAAQNTYMNNFLSYANENSKSFYKQTMDQGIINEVQKIRDSLLKDEQKKLLVHKIVENTGYGGLIHNFKNFVLRGTTKHKDRVKKQYLEIMNSIKKYKNLPNVSNKEIKLLDDIESVFTKYHNALRVVQTMHNKKRGAMAIDKTVKISDKPALVALDHLYSSFFSVESTYWFKTITKKINMLKKVDDFLSEQLTTTAHELY